MSSQYWHFKVPSRARKRIVRHYDQWVNEPLRRSNCYEKLTAVVIEKVKMFRYNHYDAISKICVHVIGVLIHVHCQRAIR